MSKPQVPGKWVQERYTDGSYSRTEVFVPDKPQVPGWVRELLSVVPDGRHCQDSCPECGEKLDFLRAVLRECGLEVTATTIKAGWQARDLIRWANEEDEP